MRETVLIVANPYDAELLRRVVVDGGYEARISVGGLSVAEQLLAIEPVVILVATGLSGVDSREIMQVIQRTVPDGAIPILLLTELKSPIATQEDAVRFGADDALPRPVDNALLLAKLRALADGKAKSTTQPGAGAHGGGATAGAVQQTERPVAAGTSERVPVRESRAELRSNDREAEAPAPTAAETGRDAVFWQKVDHVREGDYFSLLGVGPDSTPAELRSAYEQICAALDPAHLSAAVTEREAERLAEVSAVIEEAFRVLTDDSLRSAYRRHVVGS